MGGGRRVWTDPRRWGLAVTAGYVSISSLNAALSIEVDQSQIMFWGASPAAQLFSYPPPPKLECHPPLCGGGNGSKRVFRFRKGNSFFEGLGVGDHLASRFGWKAARQLGLGFLASFGGPAGSVRLLVRP